MNEPVEAAYALVRERFPEAVAAFLGGSTARGQGTATSDLDVVVILPEPAEVYRETVAWAGRPAELFVHTAASIRTMFDWDRANGAPIMSFMCAHGVVLLDLDGTAGRIRAQAARTIADGPLPPDPAVLAAKRYLVTDLRDDLLDCTDPDELLAVATALLDGAADLLAVGTGHWHGRGKWLPRWLRAADPALAGALLTGCRTLLGGGPRAPFADAVAAVLDRVGGPLREGDHRPAGPALLAGPAGLRPCPARSGSTGS
ncbi:nucleotidyltransferase domain-containing protein [Kitasatospora sp. NPDC056138]|uniref:nucleotidyltransferase domain-containing protein n=1 Tax=Kitasatospora sp. NPDC056138 TaxID=3345724 RepID=UPI0035D90F81